MPDNDIGPRDFSKKFHVFLQLHAAFNFRVESFEFFPF